MVEKTEVKIHTLGTNYRVPKIT